MFVEHEALERAREKMDKTISVFKRDLAHIRAGRANPQLLDGVTVDYYGTPTPINQVGNVFCSRATYACGVGMGHISYTGSGKGYHEG